MAEFDWVTERANCSLQKFFADLQMGSKTDVDIKNKLLRDASEPGKFVVTPNGDRFTVLREGNGHRSIGLWSVEFSLGESGISVSSNDGMIQFTGALTLNNNGECRLRVKDEELEQWQVRRMALEELFFG
jgi:hypothetical protein